jgi:hypothetical protein
MVTAYLVESWLHLLTAILLVGNALFWVVMTIGVSRSGDPAESSRLLAVVNSARWPHVVLPRALRLPFPALAWTFLIVIGVTGVLLLQSHSGTLGAVVREAPADRFGGLMRAKLALVGLLVLGQVQVTIQPRRWLALVNGGLVLAIITASVLLKR